MQDSVNQSVPIPSFTTLRGASPALLERLGCSDTWREILRQPDTWRSTGMQLQGIAACELLNGALQPAPEHIVLTGSGSSLYAGECAAPVLMAQLGVPCRAIAGGTLLVDRAGALPRAGGLLVSIARSGNSPESVGVLDAVLAHAPQWRHLVVTCNAAGRLATRYRGNSNVRVLLLDPATNDRSLVMTGSYTNLALAVGALSAPARDAQLAARVLESLFAAFGDALATWGSRKHDAVVYLGSGAAWGAARESALKMLEMSAGAVRVMPETSLGLRHGPMAWLNRDSLLVSFLSGDTDVRAYEIDLLRELSRKSLAARRIVVGEAVPAECVDNAGLSVNLPGLYALPPVHQAIVQVAVGQLLAFFQCLAQGQRPDAPSQGVLTRVVAAFPLHTGAAP